VRDADLSVRRVWNGALRDGSASGTRDGFSGGEPAERRDRYYLVWPGCRIEIDFRLDETHGPNMMVPARAGTVTCN